MSQTRTGKGSYRKRKKGDVGERERSDSSGEKPFPVGIGNSCAGGRGSSWYMWKVVGTPGGLTGLAVAAKLLNKSRESEEVSQT